MSHVNPTSIPPNATLIPIRYLIVGVNSFLGSRLAEEVEKLGHVELWKTHRCDSLECEHKKPNTICVDNLGNILTSDGGIPDFKTCYLLSTYYSREAQEIPRIVGCNVTFLVNISLNLGKKITRFVYTNTYICLLEKYASYYAQTKNLFSIFLKEYCQTNSKELVELFVFDVWGKGDKRMKIIKLFQNATPNSRLKLSPGEQLLSPISVSDATLNLLEASEIKLQAPYSSFSIRGPEWITLRQLDAMFCSLTGKPSNCEFGAREYNGDELFTPHIGISNPLRFYEFNTVAKIMSDLIGNQVKVNNL
jgi:nucleoside-diphosphate-sugar epimerase